MSARAVVVAGAVIGSAITLVLLVWPETASVPAADSAGASLAQLEAAVVPERTGRVADTAAEPIVAAEVSGSPLPAAEPKQPHAPPLPGGTPLAPTIAAPVRDAATLIVANEQSFAHPPMVAEWAAEPIDTEWAPGAQTDIFSKFAEQAGLELIALQVECRTTMCLVQMTQPSSASDDPPARLLNSLGMQPRLIMALAGQAGMKTSVAYLMRPGFAPPEMTAPSPPDNGSGSRRE